MQSLKTLIKTLLSNAVSNPKTTATGIVLIVVALGGSAVGFTADSAEGQANINTITAIITALAGFLGLATAKD